MALYVLLPVENSYSCVHLQHGTTSIAYQRLATDFFVGDWKELRIVECLAPIGRGKELRQVAD